jgi:hypothetical protein
MNNPFTRLKWPDPGKLDVTEGEFCCEESAAEL